MAYYSTFKYGSGTKYGASTVDTLRWAIQVDWFDDNYLSSGNDGPRCIACEWERGRDSFLENNTSGIRFPSVGRCVITLDNHDQVYNAWNTASELYGYIYPGHNARIGVRTPYSGASIIWRFTGRVTNIQPSGWRNGYVDITIEDALQWLYDAEIDIDVQQSIRIDEAIAQCLTAAAWPWTSDLSISSDSLAYWWAKRKASTEIADLTNSGIGYFSVLGDGTARFINRSEVSAAVIDLSDSNTLNTPQVNQPWENYKNIVKTKWFPRRLESSGVLWSDITTPLVAAGESYTTFADYTFNSENVPALYATISASDYTANSQPDGSGTNLTANFSVTLTDFGTSAKIVATNNGATPGYLTLLQIIGQAISVPYTGSFIDNRADYATNPRTWSLDLPWQQNSARAESISESMADYLSSYRPWPLIEVEARADVQFSPDVFDTVRYASAYLGIDDSFRVGKIRERWLSENGQAVKTTFVLEPYITGLGYWTWPVTDFGVDTIFG